MILRRQLLVLLRERVWELQQRGEWLPLAARSRFVDSAFGSTSKIGWSTMLLSESDKRATIDLRPFMDPSPYVINELMPLRRVYRLFNEIGVRHLTVVDCREQVVGIITRKDILPEEIEKRMMQPSNLVEYKEFLKQAGVNNRRTSATEILAKCVGSCLVSTRNSILMRQPNKPAAAPSLGESSSAQSGILSPSIGRGGSRRDARKDTKVSIHCEDGVLETRRQMSSFFRRSPSSPSGKRPSFSGLNLWSASPLGHRAGSASMESVSSCATAEESMGDFSTRSMDENNYERTPKMPPRVRKSATM
jgi:hypothetical protein